MSESFPKSGKTSKLTASSKSTQHKLASMDDKFTGTAPAASRGHLMNNYGKTPKVRSHGGVTGDVDNINRTVSYNGDKFGTNK